MTDNELLLAISNIMDKKIGPIETRIDSMEETLTDRIDMVEKRLDTKIDLLEERLDSRIDHLEEHFEKRFDQMNTRVDHLEERFDQMDTRVDHLEERFDQMDTQVQDLKFQVRKINIELENTYAPQIREIQACYLSTYKRYQNGIEKNEQLQADMELVKDVLIQHEEKLKKIS